MSLLDLEEHAGQVPHDLEVLSGPYSAMKLPSAYEMTVARTISLEPDWDHRKSGLFYHYLFSVAPLMMPVNLQQNPWNSIYPLLARSNDNSFQECLLNALLAQAAANMAHLNCRRDEMMAQAFRYHSTALELLRMSLEAGEPDFVSFLAAALTLIMAEIYLGMDDSWRIHLQAAWSFLTSQAQKKDGVPWLESNDAWIIAQSLCLMKIRTECEGTLLEQPPIGTEGERMDSNDKWTPIQSIMTRADFGFTAGLDRGFVDCLLRIEAFAADPTISLNSPCVKDLISHLEDRTVENLTGLKKPALRVKDPGACHAQAAIHHSNVVLNGIMIYLYRTIGNYGPSQLEVYVSRVFESVEEYRQLGGRNMTVWPVFQAAIEACSGANQDLARRWLADSIRLGIGNRRQLKQVIEDTWKRRDTVATVMGLAVGDVVVDWKMILSETNTDILLI